MTIEAQELRKIQALRELHYVKLDDLEFKTRRPVFKLLSKFFDLSLKHELHPEYVKTTNNPTFTGYIDWWEDHNQSIEQKAKYSKRLKLIEIYRFISTAFGWFLLAISFLYLFIPMTFILYSDSVVDKKYILVFDSLQRVAQTKGIDTSIILDLNKLPLWTYAILTVMLFFYIVTLPLSIWRFSSKILKKLKAKALVYDPPNQFLILTKFLKELEAQKQSNPEVRFPTYVSVRKEGDTHFAYLVGVDTDWEIEQLINAFTPSMEAISFIMVYRSIIGLILYPVSIWLAGESITSIIALTLMIGIGSVFFIFSEGFNFFITSVRYYLIMKLIKLRIEEKVAVLTARTEEISDKNQLLRKIEFEQTILSIRETLRFLKTVPVVPYYHYLMLAIKYTSYFTMFSLIYSYLIV